MALKPERGGGGKGRLVAAAEDVIAHTLEREKRRFALISSEGKGSREHSQVRGSRIRCREERKDAPVNCARTRKKKERIPCTIIE